MENKTINIQMVAKIAGALKDLLPKMVFVGGATISLYTDDKAADEIRPTSDIDMTVQLTGYSAWVELQERLTKLEFHPDTDRQAMCGYLYQGISVDIMPSEDGPIGKSNSWYKPGFKHLTEVTTGGQVIKILSVPYFLATKFEAFNDRGGDYRTSHDFEDIIYVIDNRTTIVEEILSADEQVKTFLIRELSKVTSSQYAEEFIRAHIHPIMVNERYPLLLEKLKKIVG